MTPSHVAAYIEYERWRAQLHREFNKTGAAWMLDDEPERRWWSKVWRGNVTDFADAYRQPR